MNTKTIQEILDETKGMEYIELSEYIRNFSVSLTNDTDAFFTIAKLTSLLTNLIDKYNDKSI